MNPKFFIPCIWTSLLFVSPVINAQESSDNVLESENLNWYNKDVQTHKVMGASVDKAYRELIPQLEPKQKVIVAVIDGGVDINHEELKGKIWINTQEIPDNNIDDDQNGYVDDVHGWNFIGNASGDNVLYGNLEVTRMVKKGNEFAEGYSKANEIYESGLEDEEKQRKKLNLISANYNKARQIIYDASGMWVNSQRELDLIESSSNEVLGAKGYLSRKYKYGISLEMVKEAIEESDLALDYYYNLEYDSREIIGDDPFNFKDVDYGNNDVMGPRASHGTSVAGVIAAIRGNEIGINGIAENVEIMVLRTTPDGDERDKDVALAIIYAVNNGAKIINMSFGKSFSPEKEFVDEAVKYAESKGVLLIHSGGNSGVDLDVEKSYPMPNYMDGSVAKNWINVGASGIKPNKQLVGKFSNYGKVNLHVFSPGVDVVSLDTDNSYSMSSGTSIAGPIVAGIAAVVWTYYPELEVEELVDLLLRSSYKVVKPKKVLVPSLKLDKREKSKFVELSQSGGIINLYNVLSELGRLYPQKSASVVP